MKIQNLKEIIRNLDGDPIGEHTLSVEEMLKQVKGNTNKESLIKALEQAIEEKDPDLTYLKVYEESCFAGLEGEKEPVKFLRALELANKVRDDKDLNADDIGAIEKGVGKSNYKPLTKALAIKNLRNSNTEKKEE